MRSLGPYVPFCSHKQLSIALSTRRDKEILRMFQDKDITHVYFRSEFSFTSSLIVFFCPYCPADVDMTQPLPFSLENTEICGFKMCSVANVNKILILCIYENYK